MKLKMGLPNISKPNNEAIQPENFRIRWNFYLICEV